MVHVKDPEALLEMLRRRDAEGSPAYRRAVDGVRTVRLDELMSRLDDEGRELLARYDEEWSRDAAALAADHFGFGFAVGSCGLVDRLVALGLVSDQPG